jgi:Outer membrane protein beta-barrel domain
MGMGIVRTIGLCVVVLGTQLFAQTQMNNKRAAATAPIFEVSAGYVYVSQTSPAQPRMGLNGIDVDGILRLTPRWGATLDLMYARNGTLPGTGKSDGVFSGLVGPVFYLMEREKTQVFVHGLIGLAVVDSAVPISSTQVFSGYEGRFSYAFGGGVERTLTPHFAARLKADYQRTTFLDPTLALEGQNNLRVTASVVYRFGNR